tara:strand:- start:775 stop:1632 length:858 start_codon:yes stop_codon:yes gene_type:complete
MALPSSGTLKISDIAGEFGGSTPHALSEYYRGGGLVPDVTQNASVPTSGTIKITDFYGAVNYTPLSILGSENWLQGSTSSTSSSQTVTLPSGTKSVIMLGNIGTNASRNTLHTTATLGSVSLTEVISQNNTPSEYTFDSIIYAANVGSLTGSQTATFNYSNSQQVYGSGHVIIYLSKTFNNLGASDSDSTATTSSPATLTLNKFGEGIQVGAATVRNSGVGMTNMDTVVNMASPSSSRNYLFGFGISSGSYNVSSTLSTAATKMQNDFGETFVAATFAPTKFDEN